MKCEAVRAWKLLRLRRDGTLAPLFINRKMIIPVEQWLQAEDHPTKGYAHRPGWHACSDPVAPHLSPKGRVWRQVELLDAVPIKRPKSQGSTWWLAKWMRVVPEPEVIR